MEPEWLTKAVILAIHDEQLAEHGGGTGVRDDGLLDSALARPQNRLAYDAAADLATLAAACGILSAGCASKGAGLEIGYL